MKIDDTQRMGGINPYRKNNDFRHSEVAGKRGKRKDEVQFSLEAMELLDTHKKAAGTDPQQQQRIEQIKQSVATGTYHVEAGKIAEKLLPYFK